MNQQPSAPKATVLGKQSPSENLQLQRNDTARTMIPRHRYTAAEDLFIRHAREQKVSWDVVATVLKDRYRDIESRNSKNMQVHFSQKIKSTVGSSSGLTSAELQDLKKSLAGCLSEFYIGVSEEFTRTRMRSIDKEFVMLNTLEWRERQWRELQHSLAVAHSMNEDKLRQRYRMK